MKPGMAERTPNFRAAYEAVDIMPRPPTAKGRPHSEGLSSSSTAAKNASMSTCSQVRARSREASSSARCASTAAAWRAMSAGASAAAAARMRWTLDSVAAILRCSLAKWGESLLISYTTRFTCSASTASMPAFALVKTVPNDAGGSEADAGAAQGACPAAPSASTSGCWRGLSDMARF
jgi:hypothetical protein